MMKKNYNRPITDAVEINALGVLMGSQVASQNMGPSAVLVPTNADEDHLF